jgi:predicted GH43/DUF377 family glycosyl hydrolase
MEPEPENPYEAEGVLNPATARGPDGALYLFPRLVAKGNYSRIGVVRVLPDDDGNPRGVERLGFALEPEADYELHAGGGGCEDPRVTFLEPLGRYIMTYTAYSSLGPRIALAESRDLFHWTRLGLATFDPCDGIECTMQDFTGIDNKDGVLFPTLLPDHQGQLSVAMIHRPLFKGTDAHETVHHPTPRNVELSSESIWISYCPVEGRKGEPHRLGHFRSHHRLACPVEPWERLKIGGGTPPFGVPHGWAFLYHGVSGTPESPGHPKRLHYSAGVMVVDKDDPWRLLYRSPEPILKAERAEEREGVVANVVFPTGVDVRTDLGTPKRVDVYYGMADYRIGAATLVVPEELPSGSRADPHEGKV